MSDIPVNTLESAQAATGDSSPERGTSLVRSVSSSWLWYLLVMLSGFVIPPLVDRHLGKKMLGVWDFGWSLVFYVNWLQVGVSGAINRYVARYRAVRDWDMLNATVNSCLLLLLISCGLGAALIVVLARAAPHLLSGLDAHMLRTAQIVVLLLGATTLLEMASSSLNSVISGYERFDILNLIRGTRDGLVLVVLVAVLLAGGGLITMALVLLATEAVQALAFLLAGMRLCPQLRIAPRYCRWSVMKDTLAFGLRTVTHSFTRGILFEINSIMVTWFLGPGALAVYSRQRSLVLSLFAFVRHYAFVLIPRSSHLDARGDQRALQRLVIDSAKYGLYMTLPPILILLIMGGPLLRIWMGRGYEAPLVLAIFALGNLPVIAQVATYSIMMGMSRHGWLVVYGVAGAVVSAAGGYIGLRLGLGILGPALAISVSMLVFDGVMQPLYACRVVKLSYRQYLAEMLPGPVFASVPFALCLGAARVFVHDSPWLVLLAGLSAGGGVLTVVYWYWVLPESLRQQIRLRLPFARPEVEPRGRTGLAHEAQQVQP